MDAGRLMVCGKVEGGEASTTDCIRSQGSCVGKGLNPAHYCGGMRYRDRFLPAYDKGANARACGRYGG